jgi:hypothetical protein
MTRQELQNEIMKLANDRIDERILRTKTVQELTNILLQAQIDEGNRQIEQAREDAFESEIRGRAETAAANEIWRLQQQEHEQRRADALLPQDKATFEHAAKTSRLFSACQANLSLARKHLSPGFREVDLRDAFQSGLMLTPPTTQETAQWDAEEIERLAPVIVDAQRNWSEDKYGRNQMLQKVRALPLDNLRERVESSRKTAGWQACRQKTSRRLRLVNAWSNVQQWFSNRTGIVHCQRTSTLRQL